MAALSNDDGWTTVRRAGARRQRLPSRQTHTNPQITLAATTVANTDRTADADASGSATEVIAATAARLRQLELDSVLTRKAFWDPEGNDCGGIARIPQLSSAASALLTKVTASSAFFDALARAAAAAPQLRARLLRDADAAAEAHVADGVLRWSAYLAAGIDDGEAAAALATAFPHVTAVVPRMRTSWIRRTSHVLYASVAAALRDSGRASAWPATLTALDAVLTPLELASRLHAEVARVCAANAENAGCAVDAVTAVDAADDGTVDRADSVMLAARMQVLKAVNVWTVATPWEFDFAKVHTWFGVLHNDEHTRATLATATAAWQPASATAATSAAYAALWSAHTADARTHAAAGVAYVGILGSPERMHFASKPLVEDAIGVIPAFAPQNSRNCSNCGNRSAAVRALGPLVAHGQDVMARMCFCDERRPLSWTTEESSGYASGAAYAWHALLRFKLLAADAPRYKAALSALATAVRAAVAKEAAADAHKGVVREAIAEFAKNDGMSLVDDSCATQLPRLRGAALNALRKRHPLLFVPVVLEQRDGVVAPLLPPPNSDGASVGPLLRVINPWATGDRAGDAAASAAAAAAARLRAERIAFVHRVAPAYTAVANALRRVPAMGAAADVARAVAATLRATAADATLATRAGWYVEERDWSGVAATAYLHARLPVSATMAAAYVRREVSKAEEAWLD